MPEYIFKGEVLLQGVTFWVTADNEDEAKRKAVAHEYDDYDIDGSETVDSEINLGTIELNE